jgi:hypothetical protein
MRTGKLGPHIVRDLLRAGMQYIGSSMRPTQIFDYFVNWTLTPWHRQYGYHHSAAEPHRRSPGRNMVNRVQVCAPVDGDYICASNISALEFNWLACCPPDVRVFKNADWTPATSHLSITRSLWKTTPLIP